MHILVTKAKEVSNYYAWYLRKIKPREGEACSTPLELVESTILVLRIA